MPPRQSIIMPPRCCALSVDCPAAGDPALRRAKASIVKRLVFTARPRMFIKKDMLYNLVRRAEPSSRDYEFAMLWLVAYAFMLRLPSEALQIQKDVGGEFTCGNHIYLDSSETVCLYLSSRKNKQHLCLFLFSEAYWSFFHI